MNPDGFQRSVNTNRHDRAAGDAPSMGRVARMPGTGLPKGTRRTRKKSEGGRDSRISDGRKRILQIWSILLIGAVVVILGLTLGLWLIPKAASSGEIVAKPPAESLDVARIASKFPSPSEEEALATVEAGLGIRDPEMIGEYFRPGAASAQEAVDFLQNLELKEGQLDRCEWLGSMDANGLLLEGVLVVFMGEGKPRNRLALLTPDAAGKWRIDFDAFARTVTPAWPEISKAESKVAQVRVYAAKDYYFNGPFADDKQWVCYGIASPDTDEVLLTYCKIGSPQAGAMRSISSNDSKMTRTTLELTRVPGAESRQFELSRVLAEDWVVGPVPFEDRFK